MEKKGYLRNMLVFAAVAIMGFCLASCKDDEDAPGTGGGTDSGLVGWYTDLSKVPNSYSFSSHDYQIGLQSIGSGFSRESFFDDEGCFDDRVLVDRVRIKSKVIYVVRIVDNSMIQSMTGLLCEDGANYGKKKDMVPVYKLYAGRNFGNLIYYAQQPAYYTYVKQGNKIIVTNGDIYTIVDGGLIKDGWTGTWSKYDPSKIY